MSKLSKEEIQEQMLVENPYMPCPKCGDTERDWNEDISCYNICSHCGYIIQDK